MWIWDANNHAMPLCLAILPFEYLSRCSIVATDSLRTTTRCQHHCPGAPVPRHRFGGAAGGTSKVLLLHDSCRKRFLLLREPCSASHSVSLACPDMRTLATTATRLRERYETVFFSVGLYRDGPDEPIHKQSQRWIFTLPNRYRGVAVPLRSAFKLLSYRQAK